MVGKQGRKVMRGLLLIARIVEPSPTSRQHPAPAVDQQG